jgi:hypothetical protein
VDVALICARTDVSLGVQKNSETENVEQSSVRLRKMSLAGVNEQTRRNFKKSGNLSGEIRIGNTKEETHERLIRPSTKLNELLFEER